MRKTTPILMLIAVLLLSLQAAAKNYNIPKFATMPTIDGTISSAEQSESLAVDMSYPAIVNAPNEGVLGAGAGSADTPPTSAADLSADWYFAWNAENLYVACRVYDSNLNWLQPSPGPFNEQDCAQLCFNFLNESTDWFSMIFDMAPETSDAAGPDLHSRNMQYLNQERLLIDGQVLGDGYVVEVLIPWTSFRASYVAKPGDVHGAGLLLVDFDPAWQTILGDFGNGAWKLDDTSAWNTFTLVDGDCGQSALADADLNGDCIVDLEDYALLAGSWNDCTDQADGCTRTIEILDDGSFQTSLNIHEPNTPTRTAGTIDWNGSAVGWNVAQWNCDINLKNYTHTVLASGAHKYDDGSKYLIVGPENTADASLVMAIDTRPEWNGVCRTSGEPWPHLLVSREGFESVPRLGSMAGFNFHCRFKLLDEGRVELPCYDPGLHAAQFLIHFTVQNLNQASAGYGDFLWFGLQVYNDRLTGIPQGGAMMDTAGSGKLIYYPSADAYTSGLIRDGDWVTYDGDMLPHMIDALTYAWGQGLLLDSQDLADYGIGHINIGWEVPGINWGVMQLDDLSAEVVVPTF